MEHYVIDLPKERLFRQFFQNGGEMDGYIYAQEGEGIGSLFGNLFKKVMPFATKALKGVVGIAKPYAKQVAAELAQEAGKDVIKTLNHKIIYTPENPKKRKRRYESDTDSDLETESDSDLESDIESDLESDLESDSDIESDSDNEIL